MSREEFFEWLNTCPSHKWEIISDEFGNTRVLFIHDEESEDD
tara:strand:- start:186 stop:311 length:126 start_codon:yes stop_codon:yes gene_type:complete